MSYNAANQLLTATFPFGAQTWAYNNLYQLQMLSQNVYFAGSPYGIEYSSTGNDMEKYPT